MMPSTIVHSIAVDGKQRGHGKLGKGHQHAHGAKVEIDNYRAVFFSKGLDQGNGETGKSGAGQGHELAENFPFQPEIEQYADADNHDDNADDFRLG
jgi:hypothetical protein